jgi:hypothetical protein
MCDVVRQRVKRDETVSNPVFLVITSILDEVYIVSDIVVGMRRRGLLTRMRTTRVIHSSDWTGR